MINIEVILIIVKIEYVFHYYNSHILVFIFVYLDLQSIWNTILYYIFIIHTYIYIGSYRINEYIIYMELKYYQ